jgi:uncharacterized protein Usg
MDYNLAKELRDAGFPQKDSEFYFGAGYSFNGGQPVYERHHRRELLPLYTWQEFLAAPTLEELIETFGDSFYSLGINQIDGDKWIAQKKDTAGYIHGTGGTTPTEAVARLWLALNKK